MIDLAELIEGRVRVTAPHAGKSGREMVITFEDLHVLGHEIGTPAQRLRGVHVE